MRSLLNTVHLPYLFNFIRVRIKGCQLLANAVLMGEKRNSIRIILAALCALILSFSSSAQCPQLYDWQGNPSSNPYWISCTGNDFTLIIQSPNNIGPYTIDWGDGGPISFGPNLIPPAF